MKPLPGQLSLDWSSLGLAPEFEKSIYSYARKIREVHNRPTRGKRSSTMAVGEARRGGFSYAPGMEPDRGDPADEGQYKLKIKSFKTGWPGWKAKAGKFPSKMVEFWILGTTDEKTNKPKTMVNFFSLSPKAGWQIQGFLIAIGWSKAVNFPPYDKPGDPAVRKMAEWFDKVLMEVKQKGSAINAVLGIEEFNRRPQNKVSEWLAAQLADENTAEGSVSEGGEEETGMEEDETGESTEDTVPASEAEKGTLYVHADEPGEGFGTVKALGQKSKKVKGAWLFQNEDGKVVAIPGDDNLTPYVEEPAEEVTPEEESAEGTDGATDLDTEGSAEDTPADEPLDEEAEQETTPLPVPPPKPVSKPAKVTTFKKPTGKEPGKKK